MNYLKFYLLISLFPNLNISAQNLTINWKDSTYYFIKLNGINSGGKILQYNNLRQAIIYLDFNEVRNTCIEKSKTQKINEEYKELSDILDTTDAGKDTVKTNLYKHELDKLVSELLMKGHALVYSFSQKMNIDSFSYRMEKYSNEAWRIYYLPDKKPFFAAFEFDGIEENLDPMKKLGQHAIEYNELGIKLRRIWKKQQ
jgi:hypothetical protein